MNDLALRLVPGDTGMCLTAIGHLDASTAYLLGEAVGALLARRTPAALVINMSAVLYLDRSGVDMLRQCHLDAKRHGVPFSIDGASPLIRRAILCYDGASLLPLDQAASGCVVVGHPPSRPTGRQCGHTLRPPERPGRNP